MICQINTLFLLDDQYIMLYKWRNDVCHLCCNGSGQSSKVNWSKNHPRSYHMMHEVKGHPLSNHVMWRGQHFKRSKSHLSGNHMMWKGSKVTHDIVMWLLICNNIDDAILRNIAQHYVILPMSHVLEIPSLLWGEKSKVKCKKVNGQKIIHDVVTWPLPKCYTHKEYMPILLC